MSGISKSERKVIPFRIIASMLDAEIKVAEICRIKGISRGTFYKRYGKLRFSPNGEKDIKNEKI